MSRAMSKNRGGLGSDNSGSSIPLMRSHNANTTSMPGTRGGEVEVRYIRSPGALLELSTRDTSIPEQQTQLKTVVEDDPYLTPISCPPTYSESEEMHRRGQGNARNSETLRKESYQRSDSGLGDSESDRGSGGAPSLTSPSLTSSRLPAHQEELYEAVEEDDPASAPSPHRAQRANDQSRQLMHSTSAPADLPQRNVPGIRQAENGYVDPNLEQAQHRSLAEMVPGHRPSSGTTSMPHTYTPLVEEPKNRAKLKCCCQVFVIILCFLISMAALGLGIFVLFSVQNAEAGSSETSPTHSVPDGSANVSDIKAVLNNLTKEMAELKRENADLKKNMTLQGRRISQAENDYAKLQDQLQEVNTLLRNSNNNYSHAIVEPQVKQFPASSFNFSTCAWHQTTMGGQQTPASNPLKTDTIPAKDEEKEYYVIFAYCTYKNATDGVLYTETAKTGTKTRFGCECWGKVPESDGASSKCSINVWMCPAYS